MTDGRTRGKSRSSFLRSFGSEEEKAEWAFRFVAGVTPLTTLLPSLIADYSKDRLIDPRVCQLKIKLHDAILLYITLLTDKTGPY